MAAGSAANSANIRGKVRDLAYVGGYYECAIEAAGAEFVLAVPCSFTAKKGETLTLHLKTRRYGRWKINLGARASQSRIRLRLCGAILLLSTVSIVTLVPLGFLIVNSFNEAPLAGGFTLSLEG